MARSCWRVHELEYLEAPHASVLVWHGIYPEGKQGCLELIHHGERIATNGDLYLPRGRWSTRGARTASPRKRLVRMALGREDSDLSYAVRVQGEGEAVRVSLDLDRPLTAEEARGARFALSLYPPAFFGRTYHLGHTSALFPRQGNGPVARTDGGVRPVPLAAGATLEVAPEDPGRHLTIAGVGCELALVDERDLYHGGWFQVSSPVPAGATTGAVEWLITPHRLRGWRRPALIGVNQVGYHPDQRKQAVIELDPRAKELGEAALLRVRPEGGVEEVMAAPVTRWGRFLRFEYALFDFTTVRQSGVYLVAYQGRQSPPFRIAPDVYQQGVWQPTLETYFPVQMCHMRVVDRARVWHGACHLDDAIQAPAPCEHFDGYSQGPTTDTPFAPFEHIPHCDRGGWHDAGDYDLAAGSQAHTTLILALARETFGVDTDQTTVRPDERLVLLHRPDDVPDIIQQVIHGVENLLSGYRAAGHSFSGIIEGTSEQNYQMGDASTRTDNLVYDPSLAPGERTADRSGDRDDRWAFTSCDTSVEYVVIQALAAASRVLRRYDEALARECLETAERSWEYEQTHPPTSQPSAYVPGRPEAQEVLATAELLLTTAENRYRQRLLALLPVIEQYIAQVGWAAARAAPEVRDAAFDTAVRAALERYRQEMAQEQATNPYGLPLHWHVWGVGWQLQQWAVEQFYLHRAHPELFPREHVLAAVNWVLGCHPGSDISFASGVGARSALIAYGCNLADWGYIPGGVVSGTNLVRPDFVEYKDDFPFLWQQAENVIGGGATFIFCVLAADRLLNQ